MGVAAKAGTTGIVEVTASADHFDLPVWDPDPQVMADLTVARYERERTGPMSRWERITDPDGLDPAGSGGANHADMLLRRITDQEALITQITLMQARDLQALRDRYRAAQDLEHGPDVPEVFTDDDGWAASEAGWALGLSEKTIRERIDIADQADRHPLARGLLTDGALPAWTAQRLLGHLDELHELLPAHRMTAVEAATVAWLKAQPRTPGQLNARMRKLILAAQADHQTEPLTNDPPPDPTAPDPGNSNEDGDQPDPGPNPDPGPGPDPRADAEDDAAVKAHSERRVWVTSSGDGNAQLCALLPEADALAVRALLNAATETNRKPPDEHRTRAQRQADILTAAITGNPAAYGRPADLPHGPHSTPLTPHIEITVPISTTTGQTNNPGEIPGYGPIPALTVRDLLTQPDPHYRGLLYDRTTGQLLGLTNPTGNLNNTIWADRQPPGTGYAHPPRTDLTLEHRDRTCRTPNCPRTARRCDKDHIIGWPKGPTTTANSCCLCRYHHRLKTHAPQWTLTGDGDNQITWTTPARRTYTTKPHDHRTPQNTPTPNNDEPPPF